MSVYCCTYDYAGEDDKVYNGVGFIEEYYEDKVVENFKKIMERKEGKEVFRVRYNKIKIYNINGFDGLK